MKKSLVLLLFLWPAVGYSQKTMNEARPEIRILLAEKIPTRFSDAEVDSAWVRAIRQCGLLAGVVVQKWDSLTTAANTYKYNLSSSFWRMRSVWRGQNQNRHPIAIVDDPFRLTQEGSLPSEYAFIHQGTTAFELHIFPVPVGAEKIFYYYYGLPAIPTVATAAADLPTPLLPALLYEAASFLFYGRAQFDSAQKLHERALEQITAYRNLTSNQGDVGGAQK